MCRRKIKIYTLILLSTTITSFQASNPRRLVIFGKDRALIESQLQMLSSDSPGIAERDVRIETPDLTSTLVKKYNPTKDQFTVILIGRDGGEKYRTHTPVSSQILFDIIDSMPMRQSEIRKKNN